MQLQYICLHWNVRKLWHTPVFSPLDLHRCYRGHKPEEVEKVSTEQHFDTNTACPNTDDEAHPRGNIWGISAKRFHLCSDGSLENGFIFLFHIHVKPPNKSVRSDLDQRPLTESNTSEPKETKHGAFRWLEVQLSDVMFVKDSFKTNKKEKIKESFKMNESSWWMNY